MEKFLCTWGMWCRKGNEMMKQFGWTVGMPAGPNLKRGRFTISRDLLSLVNELFYYLGEDFLFIDEGEVT